MKSRILAVYLSLAALAAASPSDTAKDFLSYAYGKEGVDINAICRPHDDLWMLRGVQNPEGIKAVENTRFQLNETGTFLGLVGQNIAVVEMRAGKVDATANLEMIYGLQRRLVLQFLYASLLQDKEMLRRIVTVPDNVSFGKAPKAGYGDMDQYGEILGMLPVIRSSTPTADKKSLSITYRVPLAPFGMELRLIKQGNTWKVDTANKLTVPLEAFFR